jgi:hypothetical protein
VEIECPDTCSYLSSAREHPAAVIKRQQGRDVASVLPVITALTERQHQLFFLVHSVIARHRPSGFLRLVDADVAEAADAMAATLETAARGVLYEHTPTSVVAQRLTAEIRAMLEDARARGTRIFDGELSIALRAVERGARGAHLEAPGAPDAYIALLGRLMHVRAPGPASPDQPPAKNSLILSSH